MQFSREIPKILTETDSMDTQQNIVIAYLWIKLSPV